MSTLAQIQTFISVVEEQSFAAAGKKQGVSTAAISRQISQLESYLKTQLLHRSTRSVTLTEMGLRYYQQVKKTIIELDEAELAMINSEKEATGILHINTSRYFALEYILPRLPEFLRQNPKLKIKLEFAEKLSDIARESIDIVLGSSLSHGSEIKRRRVGSTYFVLCASKDYLKEYGTPKVPEDLKQHRYITHSGRNPDNVISFENHPPIYLDPILWVNESHVLCECAIEGLGIAKLHYYIAAKALQEGQLVEVLSAFREAEQPIYLYYQASRYLQPKIRRFIDFFCV